MSTLLTRLDARNYRCLADVSLQLQPINVFFGPNGSGKSTILDMIWFIRDCAINGVEQASANRGHGIGLLWEGAADGDPLVVGLSTEEVEYRLELGLSSGRIDPLPGESLRARGPVQQKIQRRPGSDNATLYHNKIDQQVPISLREPEKLSLGMYLDFNPGDTETVALDQILRYVRYYHTRSFDFRWLKFKGSEIGYERRLEGWGRNAWSVLRNCHDRRNVDERYDTIMKYMASAFPTFKGLLLEQTGPSTVYAQFLREGGRKPLYASGASDGHLQMLLLLTALFSDGLLGESVLLIDEPELSLHPRALAVLAEAIQESPFWRKQVLIATHSPALLNHFDPKESLATLLRDGRTEIRRLSEISEVQDLLGEYSSGALYMTEAIGAQSAPISTKNGD